MSAHKLARLAPRTILPNGEGFGGFQPLEQCDLAYALAGLRDGPEALMRATYGGDHGEANMRTLYIWAWQEAASLAERHGWTPPKGQELLRALAARAVDEIVYPRLTKCPHCRGAGAVQPNQYNPNGDCRPCANTGQRNPTDAEMAAMFKLSSEEWRRVGAWYVRIFAAMVRWLNIGASHARNRLREKTC
jgi:hypothetical protein